MNINELKNVDIVTINPDTLVDISNIKINERLSAANRILDYVNQIKNPYCYRCNDYIVKINFVDTSVTLTEKLKELIQKTANADNQ